MTTFDIIYVMQSINVSFLENPSSFMGKPTFIWGNHDILRIKLFFAIICENCAKGTLRMQSTYYLAPNMHCLFGNTS